MKLLLVLRHAKAEHPPGTADRDRSLTPAGLDAAHRMGRLLAAEGLAPQLILSSDARRALQTAEAVAEVLRPPCQVVPLRELYDADNDDIIAVVASFAGVCGPEPDALMVVGHNPAFESFAGMAAGEPVELKPCGLVALELDVAAYGDLRPGAAMRLRRQFARGPNTGTLKP